MNDLELAPDFELDEIIDISDLIFRLKDESSDEILYEIRKIVKETNFLYPKANDISKLEISPSKLKELFLDLRILISLRKNELVENIPGRFRDVLNNSIFRVYPKYVTRQHVQSSYEYKNRIYRLSRQRIFLDQNQKKSLIFALQDIFYMFEKSETKLIINIQQPDFSFIVSYIDLIEFQNKISKNYNGTKVKVNE